MSVMSPRATAVPKQRRDGRVLQNFSGQKQNAAR